MDTIRIKSTHPESQGDFVIINAEDLTDDHELFESSDSKAAKKSVEKSVVKAEKKSAE